MPDRLCALLVRRGRPLEVGHVATQLLRLRRCPEHLQRRLVAEIVEGDSRLAWLGRDLVGLAPADWSDTGLASATFCVVHLETTGGSPGYSKVTEIAAVRVRTLDIKERLRQVGPGGGGRVLAKGWRTAEALEHIARAVRRLAESTDDANEAFSDG